MLKNRKLSLGAVVLYSLMLDRARLSEKNNWADEDGNIYIYFTLKDIKSQLGICKQTAENYKKELAKANLISYRRKGSSDPDMITVLPFLVPELSTVSENHTSECPENRPGQVQKTDPNNTDKNYTEVSNIYQSGMDGYDYEVTKKYLKDITEYDILSEREYNMDIIDNYIEIMARTICSTQSFIMMGEEKVPASLVRSVFMKYTSSHLIYVYDKMQSFSR